MTTTADGWYPNPDDTSSERWWYQNRWTDLTRPKSASTASGPPPPPSASVPAASDGSGSTTGYVAAAALLLAGIGLLMEMQSVTVASGAGVLFIGAAVAAIGVVVSLLFHGRTWVTVVTALVVVICVTNAVGAERTLSHRRAELQQLLNRP